MKHSFQSQLAQGSTLAKIRPQKKKIILHSRIVILLLKGSFKKEKIIFHQENL